MPEPCVSPTDRSGKSLTPTLPSQVYIGGIWLLVLWRGAAVYMEDWAVRRGVALVRHIMHTLHTLHTLAWHSMHTLHTLHTLVRHNMHTLQAGVVILQNIIQLVLNSLL
jgi:hypothetical protein